MAKMKLQENDTETQDDNEYVSAKKERTFYTKEFLQNLKSNEGHTAIKDFLQLLKEENPKQDYALEFIDNGGMLSDFIQYLDGTDKKGPAENAPVIQVFNIVLLKIVSKYPNRVANCEELCREFLVKHYPLIKSMLSLSSTPKNRKTALKLLSTLATISVTLAKDVLSYASFDQSILDVLTHAATATEGVSSRTTFIHFLLSFLVESDTTIISAFLEKRSLLASIIPGLLYDSSDTVELVLVTLQSNILENASLSKTIKMNTFNTQVIKNLVNLYNWKGPIGKSKGNFKKRMSQTIVVDPVEKRKVSECVHRFLLVLCTSKHGIIFRDPTIGLSGKVHNSLMLTVLQGLGKPWDHPLASELVLKICYACPDLIKQVLKDVVQFLEPRISHKWTNAIRFACKLINGFTPTYVGNFFDKLSIKQVGLLIQTLCIPKNITDVITTDNLSHNYLGIRDEFIKLLNTICVSVYDSLNFVDKLTIYSDNDKNKLKIITAEYLEQNLPKVSVLVKVWKLCVVENDIFEDPEIPFPPLSDHMYAVIDIFYLYHKICPAIFDDITKEINIIELLETIEYISEENQSKSDEMASRAISLFLLFDFTLFLPSADLFTHSVELLLKIYAKYASPNTAGTLTQLLKNTGIFEGCEHEIQIWLHSLLEYASYNKDIGDLLASSLKLTTENYMSYCKEITNIRGTVSEECGFDCKTLIASLSVEVSYKNMHQKKSHTILSPLIIGVLNTFLESHSDELEQYINIALVHLFHAQSAPKILTAIIFQEKYFHVLNKPIFKYYRVWNLCETLISLKKIYNNKNIVTRVSKFLISQNADVTDLLGNEMKPYHCVLLSRMVIFHLTQLAKAKSLTELFQNKCYNVVILLLKKSEEFECFSDCVSVFLKHNLLIQTFAPIENKKDDLITSFILKIILELTKTKSSSEFEPYLVAYRSILLRKLCIMLQKNKKQKAPPKNNNFMSVVRLLNFSFEQCEQLLKICSALPPECLTTPENTTSAIVELLSYILDRCLLLHKETKAFKPFGNPIFANVAKQYMYLNKYNIELKLENLEISLFDYIQQYPQSVVCFNDEVFKSVLLKPTNKYSARFAMQLLKCNRKYFDNVIELLDDIIDKRELIILLINALTNQNLPANEFVTKVYKEHEQIILKVLNKPQKVAQYFVEYYEVLIKIITDYTPVEICEEFASKSHKFDVTEIYHFEILTATYDRCIKITKDLKYISNYVTTSMNLVLNVLKRPEKTPEDANKIEKILKLFNMYLNKIINIYRINYNDKTLSQSAAFQTFSKLSLKFGLQGNASLVETLRRLCEYCSNENESYLGQLFEMAVSHSESLNILLDNTSLVKPQLIKLLLVLCKKYPSVIQKNHIPVWLGAYEGMLSLSDQCLLEIFGLYEQADVGFHEYKPYLWGNVAVGHYSVRFGVEAALWRQPKPAEVLEIFDVEKIKHTITHFPRTRTLTPHQPFYSTDDNDVYDPAFFLPLLSQLLAPESTIRWYQCKFGAIALVVMSLTSDVSEVRTAACHVLARFHSHVEAATYGKDRLLWLHFIEAICRAASKLIDLHVSSIAGTFMARCALIFNRPDHTLYHALARYIMAKECPDINYVPEMLELLHSTDVKYNEHRYFILDVMRDGLKTDIDLKIMFRSMAFKFLMDMHNSVVINQEGKRLILEILTAAVSLPMGAKIFTVNFGFPSWLYAVINNFGSADSILLSTIINLIHKLISALDADLLENIRFNILLCLISVIDRLTFIRINTPDLVKYITILYITYNASPKLITRNHLTNLLNISVRFLDCSVCNYYLDYGTTFIETPKIDSEDIHEQGVYYLKLLTLKWIQINENLSEDTKKITS